MGWGLAIGKQYIQIMRSRELSSLICNCWWSKSTFLSFTPYFSFFDNKQLFLNIILDVIINKAYYGLFVTKDD